MLVLTRKSDEELLINGNIRVRVLSIEGGRVRLGISAPKSVPVVRNELVTKARQS
jgi:carbon storage regulator